MTVKVMIIDYFEENVKYFECISDDIYETDEYRIIFWSSNNIYILEME